MIPKLIENNNLLRELTTAECLSLIDGFDEQKISYLTIHKIKLFRLLSKLTIFEQLNRKYVKLLHRLMTDPLTEASAEALKQRMFTEKTLPESDLVKMLEKDLESNRTHDHLSIYYRYANLIN